MVNPSGASYWTDQELLEKYRKGHNNKWLGILLERYLHLIFGVCMKYLKNEENAKDNTQQICLKVLKALPRHEVTYFKPWLYQVAKNHCLMALRRAGQVHILPITEQQMTEQQEESKSGRDIREEETQYTDLQRAMASLNEAQRNCLDLFYLQKKTYRGVSAATGYSLLQVKSHIQNGKRNLKMIMERLASGKTLPEELKDKKR